jgi:hypothetical protein
VEGLEVFMAKKKGNAANPDEVATVKGAVARQAAPPKKGHLGDLEPDKDPKGGPQGRGIWIHSS